METKKQMLLNYVSEKDLIDLKKGFESLLSITTDPGLVEMHGGFGKNEIYGVDFLIRALRIIDQGKN